MAGFDRRDRALGGLSAYALGPDLEVALLRSQGLLGVAERAVGLGLPEVALGVGGLDGDRLSELVEGGRATR